MASFSVVNNIAAANAQANLVGSNNGLRTSLTRLSFIPVVSSARRPTVRGAAAAHDDEQLSWSPPRVLPPRRDELGDDLLGHCVRMRQRSARTIDELLYTAALVPLDPLVAGLTADPESLA